MTRTLPASTPSWPDLIRQERHDNSLRAIKGYCRQRTTDQVIAELN